MAHQPTGGVRTLCLRQTLCSATSESANSFASVVIGLVHTSSWNSARVNVLKAAPVLRQVVVAIGRGTLRIHAAEVFRVVMQEATLSL